MQDSDIKNLVRKILREDMSSDAISSVYNKLEPLTNLNLGNIKEVEKTVSEPIIGGLAMGKILEKIPNNPKKAFMIYSSLYQTLTEGAPTIEEVKEMWKKYSESQNIIMYVMKISKIINKYQGNDTITFLK